MSDNQSWRSIGNHQLRMEEPNLVRLRLRGDLIPAEVTQIVDAILAFAAVHGRLVLLSDISAVDSAPAESRRVMMQRNVLDSLAAIAYVGGSFGQRILATLAITAGKLGTRKQQVPPVRFFATEAEARAWLESVRHL